MSTRRIAHVDMDAFYASIEIRDDPALAGLPVVVGGAKETRGVVCAASYEARRYGVRSAMPMAEALRRCPGLVRIPVRMAHYVDESRRVMDILGRYAPTIEPLSLDEAFLDLTGSERSLGSSIDVARRIKDEIFATTSLTASIGIAPVKFVAKIASELRKPDGTVIVDPGNVRAFLAPLEIRRLWGVGPQTQLVLEELGVHTIGDLAEVDAKVLERRFGKSGHTLQALARGDDDREVVAERDAKSYSHEMTFAVDQTSREVLQATLLDQVNRVARRLRRDGVAARTVVLKLRDHRFRTITRRTTRAEATCEVDAIYASALALFDAAWDGRPVRLIGAGASGIRTDAAEPSLLEADPRRTRGRRLEDVIDHLEDRFGSGKIQRAGALRARDVEDTGASLSLEPRRAPPATPRPRPKSGPPDRSPR